MPSLRYMAPNWVKTLVRNSSLRWQYRLVTWQNRVFPDFIIIGVQKSGTTSLYSYLCQHPELLPSCTKEVHFFDGGLNPSIDNFQKGQAWYRAHFPLKRNVNAHQKAFEATPIYMFNPLASKRIFDLLPKVKVIALLRNPTERAISHYFHEKQKQRESLPIYEALQQEEARLAPIIKDKDYKNPIFKNCSYKSRGLYKDQLERYLKYFPWRQILVINSDEFFAEPENTLRQVFEFVEVDTGYRVKNLTPRNVANNKSDVSPETYEYLYNYFLPHNKALYELVGKSYGW